MASAAFAAQPEAILAPRLNVAAPAAGARFMENRMWSSPTGREQDARVIESLWIRFRQKCLIDLVRLPYLYQPNEWTRVFDPQLFLDNYPVDYKIQFSPDEGRTLVTLVDVKNQPRPYPLSTHWTEHLVGAVRTNNLRVLISRTSKGHFPHMPSLARPPEVWGTFLQDDAEPPVSASSYDDDNGPILQEDVNSPRANSKIHPAVTDNLTSPPHQPASLTMAETPDEVTFESPYLKLGFSKKSPRLRYLSWDGVGEGKLTQNFLRQDKPSEPILETFTGSFQPNASNIRWGQTFIKYQNVRMGDDLAYDLTFIVRPKSFSLQVVRHSARTIHAFESAPFQLWFDPKNVPIHVLGLALKQGPVGQCSLPSIIHAVDQGSLRVTADAGMPAARLQVKGRGEEVAVTVAFLGPATATSIGDFLIAAGKQQWGATFDVVTVSPFAERLSGKRTIQVLRKGWLNALAFRPELGGFGLNSMRDVNRLGLYMYADNALFTPELAPGLSALDLVRQSLETFMAGLPTYDGDGNIREYFFADAIPSLLISTWDYVVGKQDFAWLKLNWHGIRLWGQQLESMDRDGSGLIASLRPGISGVWSGPALWLDAINFGHQDAYSNALAYRAFKDLSELAEKIGEREDANRFALRAQQIRNVYRSTFWNPQTGLISGWRSADGQLHDYQFVFINGIAVVYKLLDRRDGASVIDRIHQRFEELHYRRYDLGLPVNLLPIARGDYAPNSRGSPLKEDGSDSYQNYFNGGATAFFAYWYIQALYDVDERAEADGILFSLLQSLSEGRGGLEQGITGTGAGGEWRDWSGVPTGMEGYMADSYHFLLAVITGYLQVEVTPDYLLLRPHSPLNKGGETRRVPLSDIQGFLQ